MSAPRVSVLLNSYNQAPWLQEAIDSVLGQTFTDFELVAADNGSTDDSPRIIREAAERDRRVVPLLHPKNDKISVRFNQSIQRATGELATFLYSDDYFHPNKLAKQVDLFDRAGAECGVVYCPAMGKNELSGTTWQYPTFSGSGLVLKDLIEHNHVGPINMLSPMTRRSLLLQYPFHEDIFTEGEFWFMRAAMRNRFVYDAEPLVTLRDHGSNAGKAVQANIEMTEVAIERLASSPEFPEDARAALRRFHAIMLRNGAWSALRTEGDTGWARKAFLQAIRIDRRAGVHPRSVLGLPLTLLPVRAKRALNGMANRLRRGPDNVATVQDFRTDNAK